MQNPFVLSPDSLKTLPSNRPMKYHFHLYPLYCVFTGHFVNFVSLFENNVILFSIKMRSFKDAIKAKADFQIFPMKPSPQYEL